MSSANPPLAPRLKSPNLPLLLLDGKQKQVEELYTADPHTLKIILKGMTSLTETVCKQHPHLAEQAADLALVAYLPSQRRGVGYLWTAVLSQLFLQLAGSRTPHEVRVLNRLGQQLRMEHQLDLAVSHHQQALAVAYQLEESRWLAQSHWFLADDYVEKRAYLLARQQAEQAEQLWQEGDADAERWRGALANTLGRIAQAEQRYDEAKRYLEQARDIHTALGLRVETARNWLNLGVLAQEVGDFGRAQQCYEQALALTDGNLDEQAKIQKSLGVLQANQGNFEQAVVLFSAAQQLFSAGQISLLTRAEITHNLVYALRRCQKWAQVIDLAPQAVAYWTQLDNKVMLSWTLDNWAQALKEMGQYAEARQRYEEALTCVADLPDQEEWRATLQGYIAQFDEEG
jgi:tetratricopeptide (TPR) repeat protein